MRNKPDPLSQYSDLMRVIAKRFAQIRLLRDDGVHSPQDAETIGFQLRKIIEGIAFGCLVAVDNGLRFVPREAAGQWNADRIFSALKKRKIVTLPNPNLQREPSPEERLQYPGIKYVMEGQPHLCLTHDQLSEIYRRTHMWTHEANPYLGRQFDLDDVAQLEADVEAVFGMMGFHIIGINGQSFWCDMTDLDSGPKIASASKVGELDKVQAVI